MRLIDADKLLEHFPEEQAVINGHIRMGYAVGVGNVRDIINAAPTIEADIKCEDCKTIIALKAALEPVKTGKWIDHPQFGSQCSECGLAMFEITGAQYCDFKPNYCPNCGAKMENP